MLFNCREMKVAIILLLAIFAGTQAKTNPTSLDHDFNLHDYLYHDWKCNMTLTRTGNYPRHPPIGELADVASSNWTSVSLEEKDLLAHNWTKSVAGLDIKPDLPNSDNKIIIHLAGSLAHPTESPYEKMNQFSMADAIKTSSSDHGKDVLAKSPFNCYIRRDLDYMNDVVSEHIDDCLPDKPLSDCPRKQDTWQNFQCTVGASSPACCYSSLFKEAKNSTILQQLKAVYGAKSVTSDLEKCSEPQAEKDVEAECPPPEGLSKEEREKYYMFNRNSSCNEFLAPTQRSCSVSRKGETYTMPCFGRCMTGMMINIEITPTSKDSSDVSETVVTVLQRYAEFNQKFYDKAIENARDQNEFGYNANIRKVSSKSQIQILKKKVNPIPMVAGVWNGIWLQWTFRPPACLKSKNNIMAPVLRAGLEGSDEPVFELDFACTNFEGDNNFMFIIK